MASSEIPCATEQGIFAGLTGIFFQRTGNSGTGTENFDGTNILAIRVEESDHRHLWLLRAGGKRSGERRAAEKCDELAPPHARRPKRITYWKDSTPRSGDVSRSGANDRHWTRASP
jgi:hypothetical protein